MSLYFKRHIATGCTFLLALFCASGPPSVKAQDKLKDEGRRIVEELISSGNRLKAQWKKKSLELAARNYQAALVRCRSNDLPKEEAVVLKQLGEVQVSLSDFAAALTTYRELFGVGKRLQDQQLQVDALNSLAKAHLEIADANGAGPYILQALKASAQINYSHGTIEALNHQGVASSISSDVAKALESFEAAAKLLPNGVRDQLYGQTKLNFGYLHSNLGNLQLSEQSYQEALAVWRTTNDQQRQAFTLTALAGVYIQLGERQKALELHEEALGLFRTIGNKNGEASTLNGLGYFYDDIGDRDRALDCYTRALSLFEEIRNQNYAGITMGYLGRVHAALGDKDKALAFYDRKLAISRSVQDRRMESYTLRDIGNVLNANNQLDQALKNFKEAQLLSQRVLDRRGEAHILLSIGSVLSKTGRLPEALTKYRQALTLMQSVTDRRGEVNAWYSVALAERDLGHLEESRKAIESSIALIENLRIKTASSSLRISYLNTVYQHYEFYTDLLMRCHRENPGAGFDKIALEANDRGRARTLLENLINGGTEIHQGLDPQLVAEGTKARKLLNQKAEEQMRLLSIGSASQKSAAVQNELKDLLADYELIDAKVRDRSPHYAALVQPPPLKLVDIQQALDKDSLVIEFSLGSETSYGWALTDTTFNSFALPDRAKLEDAAKDLYNVLTTEFERKRGESASEHQQRIAKSEAEYPKAAERLSSLILTPLKPYLTRKRLVIVADGLLQYIPFSALPDPTVDGPSDSRPPLIDKHEIVSIPSLSTFLVLRKELRAKPPSTNELFVLADPVFEVDDPRLRQSKLSRTQRPNDVLQRASESLGSQDLPREFGRLPFTLMEANAISAIVSEGNSKKVLSFHANLKTALGPELKQYRIVHFATHGLLNNSRPELSGIVLSLFDESGRRQDGFLRLNDIYNLDLQTDLVVLSACQTALGKEARGEGLISLTRGFMYAGAPRVVASLWRINDGSTADLMKFFYEAMFEQKLPPAAALRSAQLKMLQNKKWHSPHHWAAFVIQGEWN